MTILLRIAAETRTRIAKARERGDEGQGTLEYVGIAVLIGLIMTAIFGLNLDTTIKSAIDKAVKAITKG
jgi:hypothetical protein